MRPWLLAALTLCLVLPSRAQDRPDLTGSWALDPARSETLTHSGGPPPNRLVIAHKGNEITIEATRGSEREVTTYFFERAAPAGEGARVGRWSWDGLRVVTERTGDVQGQTVTAKQLYGLGTGGTELTVETIVEVQHGYTLRGTKNYGTAKDVYTRPKPQMAQASR